MSTTWDGTTKITLGDDDVLTVHLTADTVLLSYGGQTIGIEEELWPEVLYAVECLTRGREAAVEAVQSQRRS